MIALDTNVVVRLIARDDQEQHERAARLLDLEICFIPDTVLLEVAWVLKTMRGSSREQIHSALVRLLGNRNIRVANPERTAQALAWYADGLDFADALHLAGSQEAVAFFSFDRDLVRRAVSRGNCPVIEPPAGRPG